MDDFFKKCPNGIYSEIKYDGERVQLHKSEKQFKFFSRSLKPVLGHKVNIFNTQSKINILKRLYDVDIIYYLYYSIH